MKEHPQADCECITCARMLHSLGVARHRAMHRDKNEDCTIEFSDGRVTRWNYSKQKTK